MVNIVEKGACNMKKDITSSIAKAIFYFLVIITFFGVGKIQVNADEIVDMDNYGEIAVEDEYIENPHEETEEGSIDSSETLPSSYGNTSKIAYNQGSSPTCWAFAGTSLFELKVDKEKGVGDTFLSVEHLVEKTSIVGKCGFNTKVKAGGNHTLYSAYFISGYGPVNGIDFPWKDPITLIDDYDFGQAEYRATDIRYIASERDADNTWSENTANIVKEEVINNGGITCSFLWDSKYYNETQSSYYAYDDGLSTNHHVVIVGWDDSYSKENFVVQPKANGAWLVKNSWGPLFGTNGYFWISYEDLSIIPRISICEYEAMDKYQKVYNLDESGRNSDYIAAQRQQGFINVFDIEENEELDSVTFFQSSTTAICQLYYVPINSNGVPDIKNKVALGNSIHVKYSGYHTIDIKEEIEMTKNSKCGIMVYVEDGSKNARIGTEATTSYTTRTINEGESFLCNTSNVLTDFSTLNTEYGNFSIKLATRRAININKCMIDSIPDQTYSGKEIKPHLNIIYEDYELVENTDYILEYRDNVNAGTAVVTVTGIGYYKGQRDVKFEINCVQIEDLVIAPIDPQGYTGDKLYVVPKVYYNSTELVYGQDYGVSFLKCTDIGTAMIVVVGLRNYTGIKYVYYTITNDLSYATIEGYYDYEYNGSYPPFTPTVRIGETILTQNKDYVVTVLPHYHPNNADTYYYHVIGMNDYTGSSYITYKVLPADISKATISSIPTQIYTGSAIKPEPTITYKGMTLVKDVDYTLSYSNNTNKGTAKITIMGIGNFKGSTNKTFIIN